VSDRPGTLIDSSVLLDIFTEDPKFFDWSQAQLMSAAERGAIILNAVVLAEISPRFPRLEELRSVLPSMATIEEMPVEAAFLAGHAHVEYRRSGGTRQAILPDFLIGAHAAVTGRSLLTRDPRRVARYIPATELITPG
jgi:predicted nucleic acid-binding protein